MGEQSLLQCSVPSNRKHTKILWENVLLLYYSRMKEAEEMLQKMNATHEKYSVVTTQGSVIHFAMASLPETDAMYQGFLFKLFLASLFNISFKKTGFCMTRFKCPKIAFY